MDKSDFFGVESTANKVLHPWLKQNLTELVADLPPPIQSVSDEEHRAIWEGWRQGLTVKFTLPEQLPPLRLLLISVDGKFFEKAIANPSLIFISIRFKY